MSAPTVPTARVVGVLRANGFTFKRQGPNANLWRKSGTKQFAWVPRRQVLAVSEVEHILLIATNGSQEAMRRHIDAWTQDARP